MRDNDSKSSTSNPPSGPADPTRRKFLVNTGTAAAASVIGAYLPANARSVDEQSGSDRSKHEHSRPSKERFQSFSTSTVRTTNFTSILGQRCWIASVKLWLLPEQKKAVITGNAAHARCM